MIFNKQIFTSSDGKYFDKYAKLLLSSININSPGSKLVFHTINPTQNYYDSVEKLKDLANGITLEFIIEEMDLESFDDKGKKVFFSCIRFIKFADFFCENKTNTLFVDIDTIVKKDLMHIDIEHEGCDVAIHMRPKKKDKHLKLLAGVIWFKYSKGSKEVVNLIANKLNKNNLSWFDDQIAIYDSLFSLKDKIKIFNLDRKFIDWNYHDDSYIWVGKGERKDTDEKYLSYAKSLLDEFEKKKDTVILCPRVDLGFKEGSSLKDKVIANRLKDSVRIHWLYFSKIIKDISLTEGDATEIITLPQWQITEAYIKGLNHKKIFVPHKNKEQIDDSRVCFYMQEVYPFFFTLDRYGWGGGSSICGSDEYKNIESTLEAKEFVNVILKNKITKHRQGISNDNFDYDIFFPLQIPSDETLKYHSDYQLKEVVEAIILWSIKYKVKVLFKCHPMNQDLSYIDMSNVDSELIHFAEGGNVHDYILKSKAVFVINSGVGFEAILHGKPVVTFGRSVYDVLSAKSTISNIQETYVKAISCDAAALKERYLKFIQWYFFEHGYLLNKASLANSSVQRGWVNNFSSDIENILRLSDSKKNIFKFKDIAKPKKPISRYKHILKKISLIVRRKLIRHNLNDFDASMFSGKKIALVGNGKSILKGEFGKEIDQHDIVIRMNLGHPLTLKKDKDGIPLAPKKKILGTFKDRRVSPIETHYIANNSLSMKHSEIYTNIKHVGSKTTIWSCSTADKNRQSKYIDFFSDALPLWIHPAVETISDKILARINLASSHYYVGLKKKYGIEPSSGLVLLEMLRCSDAAEVNVYGFDFFSSGHISRSKNTKKFFHSPAKEEEIADKMILSSQKISLRHFEKTNWVQDYIKGSDVILLNFGPLKKNIFRNIFKHAGANSISNLKKDFKFDAAMIKKLKRSKVFIWSILDDKTERLLKIQSINIVRVEDGFIHSVERNSNAVAGYSWCFDKGGVYFDRNSPTDIENILNNYHFSNKVIQESLPIFNRYLSSGISKYNFQDPVDITEVYGVKKRRRILVVGQVEDDKSIQYGMENKMTNNDLVWLAKEENPDAEIIYKPHPDVLTGKRSSNSYSDPRSVESISTVIYKDLSIKDSLNTVDQVYTMTSLVGFESAIRGIKTTVLGTPFYAGWGLTDDRGSTSHRRCRKLNEIKLFIGVILVYPHYFKSGDLVNPETIIDTVSSKRHLIEHEQKLRKHG